MAIPERRDRSRSSWDVSSCTAAREEGGKLKRARRRGRVGREGEEEHAYSSLPLGLSTGLGVVMTRGFLFPAWGVLVFLAFPLGAGLLGLSCLALLELTICYTTEKAGLGSGKAGLGSGKAGLESGKAASHSVTGLCMIKIQLRLAHPGELSEGQGW